MEGGPKMADHVAVTKKSWAELAKWIALREARMQALEDCAGVKP